VPGLLVQPLVLFSFLLLSVLAFLLSFKTTATVFSSSSTLVRFLQSPHKKYTATSKYTTMKISLGYLAVLVCAHQLLIQSSPNMITLTSASPIPMPMSPEEAAAAAAAAAAAKLIKDGGGGLSGAGSGKPSDTPIATTGPGQMTPPVSKIDPPPPVAGGASGGATGASLPASGGNWATNKMKRSGLSGEDYISSHYLKDTSESNGLLQRRRRRGLYERRGNGGELKEEVVSPNSAEVA
jgi:hypothetical protein